MEIYSNNLKDELIQRGWKPRAHIEYWVFDDEAQTAIDEIEAQVDQNFLLLAEKLIDDYKA